ncbi:hypothetical protein HDV01_007086 [Terramyces sp. JEL0728]|nr:hypothetical protein HDV01_007086 [Terramyces sp. JEL0728]
MRSFLYLVLSIVLATSGKKTTKVAYPTETMDYPAPTVTHSKNPKTKSPKHTDTAEGTYTAGGMYTDTPKQTKAQAAQPGITACCPLPQLYEIIFTRDLQIMKWLKSIRWAQKSIRFASSERQNFEVSQYINILTAEGFKKPEAEALVSLISEVIEESLQASSKSLGNLLKKEQEKFMGESQSELKRLQTDIKLLEQKDFGMLKSNLDGIKFDVDKVKGNIRDDINRVHAGVRLDMNLEKSRIQVEAADLLDQLKLAEERIDLQVDKLEVRMGKIKNATKTSVSRFLLTIFVMLVTYKTILRMEPLHTPAPAPKKVDSGE